MRQLVISTRALLRQASPSSRTATELVTRDMKDNLLRAAELMAELSLVNGPQQRQQQMSEKREAGLAPRRSTSSSPLRYTHCVPTSSSSTEERDPPPPLPSFQCPYCFARADASDVDRLRWYSPQELCRHVSWCHPHMGAVPQDLEPFNHHIIRMILDRGHHEGRGKCERERRARPFELILLIDLANVVLDAGTSIATLLRSEESREFFTETAVAVCPVHETFVPHTAVNVDALFALSQLNPHSDFFPVYAITGLEAGDLASAAFVGSLLSGGTRRPPSLHGRHDEDSTGSSFLSAPPVALITKDMHQRFCMAEAMFKDTVFTPLTGGFSRTTILETCRRALREGTHS